MVSDKTANQTCRIMAEQIVDTHLTATSRGRGAYHRYSHKCLG
jgi:hypothetical protein